MEELTCGNIENTRTKYMMPPIKSNCQFFFRNLRIFPNAICIKLKKKSRKENVIPIISTHIETKHLALPIKGI
jgi:hypothetical protein